jgi:hypothetical protein
MNFKKLLALGFAFCILSSCRQGYKVENGKVYYEYWNEGVGQGKQVLEAANAATFEVLNFKCDCDFSFGRDKQHLFIDGVMIKQVDPNTFKYLDNYTFADKDSAYFYGFYNDLKDCTIKGIDLKQLKFIKYPWSKANDILIYGSDTLRLDDINEFIPIDRDWGKTRTKVINRNKGLAGADPNTFQAINSYSGKDNTHYYEFGKVAKR